MKKTFQAYFPHLQKGAHSGLPHSVKVSTHSNSNLLAVFIPYDIVVTIIVIATRLWRILGFFLAGVEEQEEPVTLLCAEKGEGGRSHQGGKDVLLVLLLQKQQHVRHQQHQDVWRESGQHQRPGQRLASFLGVRPELFSPDDSLPSGRFLLPCSLPPAVLTAQKCPGKRCLYHQIKQLLGQRRLGVGGVTSASEENPLHPAEAGSVTWRLLTPGALQTSPGCIIVHINITRTCIFLGERVQNFREHEKHSQSGRGSPLNSMPHN